MQLHRSQDAELKTSNCLVAEEDKKLIASISKESEGCINIDICAPDTIDYAQGTYSFCVRLFIYMSVMIVQIVDFFPLLVHQQRK